jgi:DNA polymerase-3 subunit beta
MKLTVTQKILDKAIKSVVKAIPAKGIQPILNNIFIETQDSHLKLIATDLDFWIEALMPSSNEQAGNVAVSAKKLEEIVSKFKADDVALELNPENQTLNLATKQANFDLLGLAGSEFPTFDKPDHAVQSFITINTQKFIEIVNIIQISASKFDVSNILGGIYIGLKEKFNEETQSEQYFIEFASSDGGRLSAFSMPLDNVSPEHKFTHKAVIVPLKVINDIKNIIDSSVDDQVQIAFLGSQVIFKTEDRYVVSRLLEGEFPNFMELIPANQDKSAVINRKNLLESLDRVSVMANEVTNLVKLTFLDNELTLECNNLDYGQALETVALKEYNGADITIYFNVRYLMDYLKAISAEEIELQMSSQESPALVKPSEGDQFLYVIMPLKAGK